MRVTVIHNPSAGDGDLSRDDLLELVWQAGLTPTYGEAKDPQLAALLRQPAEFVAAAGGDGTVAKLVLALEDRSVPVAILPAGTANNIARSFGIGGPAPIVIDGWAGAMRRRLRVGHAAGPWGSERFVEAVGIGALAAAMAAAAGMPAPTGERMARAREALRRALEEARPLEAAVTIDGEALPGDLLLVEVMNIPYAGSGLKLAPQADPGDELLDVVALEAGQRGAMLAWLAEPEPSSPAPVSVRRGRTVGFMWAGEPLHLDDEFPRTPEQPGRVELGLEAEPVIVLVPAAAGPA
ncbi:diacylglycerol/lipid kinase family protein [Benzoatithermus flavus]|uniref:Diacylglycerol kinase family protein n=1 Tax=Benzoatithermus flavus TaxID=3108223 RepID=A0ABU8XRT2_9PROT